MHGRGRGPILGRMSLLAAAFLLLTAPASGERHRDSIWGQPDSIWNARPAGHVRYNKAPDLLPELSANPAQPEYRRYWRGTRDYGPAHEKNATFIGGYEFDDPHMKEPEELEIVRFGAAAPARRRPPVVFVREPGRDLAPPPAFDWGARLPADSPPPAAQPVARARKPAAAPRPDAEPGVPADFQAQYTPGSLGALGPAPYHEIAMVRAPAERLVPVRTSPAHEPLPTLPSGPKESLPELGAPAGPSAQDYEVDVLLGNVAERSAPAAEELARLPSGPKERLPSLGAAPYHEAPAAEPKPVVLEEVDAPLTHDAVPDLIALLASHPNPKLRARVADELSGRGHSADAAEPALVAALRDASDRVKASAALALGNVGVDKPKIKKALSPLLKHASADVRTSAQTSLDRLGN